MRIKIFLMLMCFLIVNSFAVEFDVDYAVFKGNEEVSVVEVYLLIPRTLFQFVPNENEYRSYALIRVALVEGDSVRDIQEWQITDRVADTLQLAENQKIPEIATLQVKPGNYQLIIVVADLINRHQYRYDKQIEISDYSDDQLRLSDIQISSQISKTSQENKFSKYFGYDVIPNASAIFSQRQNLIYSFVEVYNLKVDPGKPSNYLVKYDIADLNGKVVVSSDCRSRKKPGTSAVEINNLSIAGLPGGLYDLIIEVNDEATQKTVKKTKRFYILESKSQLASLEMNAEAIQLEGKSEKNLMTFLDPYDT